MLLTKDVWEFLPFLFPSRPFGKGLPSKTSHNIENSPFDTSHRAATRSCLYLIHQHGDRYVLASFIGQFIAAQY